MERQPRAEIEARTGSALKRCWLGIRAHIRGERDHSRAMALPDRLSMLQATLEKVRDLRRSSFPGMTPRHGCRTHLQAGAGIESLILELRHLPPSTTSAEIT